MADTLQRGVEVNDRRKAQCALAEVAGREDGCRERGISEVQDLAGLGSFLQA
jgi:hypothetical protein